MNLIELRSSLVRLDNKLSLRAEKRNDNITFKILNWMELSNTLHQLREFSFLKKQVDDIFSIDDNINLRADEWIAKIDTHNKILNSLKKLRESIDSCVILIDDYTGEDFEVPKDSGLINVKMPNIIDMNKMSDICDELDMVFGQCPLIKDEVKFIGVEKGSVYFVFVSTITSITAIGMILNIALDIQKKYYQNQMLKSKLETMMGIEGSTKEIIKKLDDEVEEYCKIKSSEIEGAVDLNPEERTRLILSIKTLHELMGKGVQMQCSLCEGEDNSTISSFPKIEEFTKLLETIKLIE